ncbi:MAG: hypothetical protein ACRECH_09645 [Nitrososphaerales archaeon]
MQPGYALLLLGIVVIFSALVIIALFQHVDIKASLKIPLALVSFETKGRDSDDRSTKGPAA